MTATARIIRSAARTLRRYGALQTFNKRTTTGTKSGGLTPAIGASVSALTAFVPESVENAEGRRITTKQLWIDAAPFVAVSKELDEKWTVSVGGNPVGFETPVIVHRPEPAAAPVVFQATLAS